MHFHARSCLLQRSCFGESHLACRAMSDHGKALRVEGRRRRQQNTTQPLEALPRGLQDCIACGLCSLSLAAVAYLAPADALAAPSATAPAAVNAITAEGVSVQERTRQREATSQVYFDITVDGKLLGRIVVQTLPDAPVGSQRFLELAKGINGVSYTRSKIDGISESFITSSGVLNLNYSAAGLSSIAGGDTVEQLEAEAQVSKLHHDRPGLVSLIVTDTAPKAIKERLVAYQGKFVKVQDVRAPSANGTGFAITTSSSPVLDKTNLVIGKVIEGMDVVEKIAKLPKVQSKTGSPFFKAAKVLGDRRADVAEKAFGKPLSRVVIAQAGIDPSTADAL